MNKALIVFGLLLFAQHATANIESTAEIKAPDGTFVGISTATGQQFLGIPYAEPPVGELRWAAPRPLSNKPGRFIAQKFGSRCVQPINMWNFNPKPGEAMHGSEDCLFLNIYASRKQTSSKPVMVWIHGGGFVTGAGEEYDVHVLAEKHDVIVLTINYRLGALGFLSHPTFGEESGNFGLLDQQMALRWVQRNIAAFGGDPKRVTIFGESAGGVSVCMQLGSPEAKGLYSRAIDQSGPCVAIDRKIADQKGVRYAQAAGCTASEQDVLGCLRKLPALTAAANSPGDAGLGDTAWTLVSGTKVVPKMGPNFTRVYENGEFNHVPFMNGSNLDEGKLFAMAAMSLLKSEGDYQKNVQLQFGSKADQVLAQYPASGYKLPALAYAAYITDWLFACPALGASQAIARYSPVYAYEFSDRAAPSHSVPPEEIGGLGAYHAAEIQYVFQTKSPWGGPAEFTPEQKRLSDQMQEAWVSFARDGVPSIAGEVPWEPLRPGKERVRILAPDGPAYVSDFTGRHNCSFWFAQ